MDLDPRHFRSVLGHFATGVAVVTAMSGDRPRGLTVQSFASLSLDPPLVLVCPARASRSWPEIGSAGRLCVNLLAEDQEPLARRFSISGSPKFDGVAWQPSAVTGSPVLDGVLATIDCSLQEVHPGGDHLIAVCRVLAVAADPERRPLLFYRSGFTRMPPP